MGLSFDLAKKKKLGMLKFLISIKLSGCIVKKKMNGLTVAAGSNWTLNINWLNALG